jgi:hypothetical protein
MEARDAASPPAPKAFGHASLQQCRAWIAVATSGSWFARRGVNAFAHLSTALCQNSATHPVCAVFCMVVHVHADHWLHSSRGVPQHAAGAVVCTTPAPARTRMHACTHAHSDLHRSSSAHAHAGSAKGWCSSSTNHCGLCRRQADGRRTCCRPSHRVERVACALPHHSHHLYVAITLIQCPHARQHS